MLELTMFGATGKNVKDEYPHGCPLDHPHCVTCVKRACRVRADSVASCDIVDCPRGCNGRYHRCKETEHLLLCPEEQVACLNSAYGCPVFLHRKKVAGHLRTCPASVVHCKAWWSRSTLEPASQGKKPPMLLKKVYTDCGQLDTASAMSDHRTLINLLCNPQRTRRTSHNSLPRVYRYPRARVLYPLSGPSDVYHAELCQDLLGDVSDDDLSAMVHGSSSGGDSQRLSQGSVCYPDNMDVSMNEEKQALKSVLSLDLHILCAILDNAGITIRQSRGRNYFTFCCGHDFRRDEFQHHFHTVHDRIQSDLSGWMEQRCPLAYMGCPFSFRRFRPNLPGMTVCHSWLLESFGLTHLCSQDDCSHQTPSHLMPMSAETADTDGSTADCDGSLQISQFQLSHVQKKQSPTSQSKCIEGSPGDLGQKESSTSYHGDEHTAASSVKCQGQVSSTSSVRAQISPIPNSARMVPFQDTNFCDKHVLYTALSADSCIRVDFTPSQSSEETPTTKNAKKLQLADMPAEILRYIAQLLDGFSLCNLSLVSRGMRELCCSLLQDRGVVSLVWEKQQQGDRVVWRAVDKLWSFTRSFDPVESWSLTGDNPISNHLQTCPYNQDRVQHTDKFCIIPVSDLTQ